MKILKEDIKKICLNIVTTMLAVLVGFVSVSAASEIHGIKWNDTNFNSVMDVSEVGVPGITICYNTSAGPSDCTLTDVDGNYTFAGLGAGNYTIYEILPTGTYQTYPTCRNCTLPTIPGAGSGFHFVRLLGLVGEIITKIDFGNKIIIPPLPDVKVVNQYDNQNGIPIIYRPMLSEANPLKIQKNLSGVTGTILSVNVTLLWSDGTSITANMANIGGTIWEVDVAPPPGGFRSGLAEMTFYVDVSPSGPGSEDVIQVGDIIFLDPSGKILDICTGNPIEGATVNLYVQNISGDFIEATTGIIPLKNPLISGTEGNYSWMVSAGTYKIKAEKSGYFFGWSDPVIVMFEPITNVDISLTPLVGCAPLPAKGSISGTKFNDLNGNGVRDPGEPAMSNIFINLEDSGGNFIKQTQTDGNGNYTFINLQPGTYIVDELGQWGWITTEPSSGKYTVILNSGDQITGIDFGNFQLGFIFGKKFNDLNGNGILDSGEPGLDNWTIILTMPDGSTQSTITHTNGTFDGIYHFAGLTAGNYAIREELQPGWIQTKPVSGSYNVTIISGSMIGDVSSGNVSFGNFELGEIHGIKFEDINADGKKDAGEQGLSGWNITINGTDTITGTPVNITTTTDAGGNYSFTNLSAGNYTIREALKPGWMQTAPTPIPPGTYTVNLTSGETVIEKDFGNQRMPPKAACVKGPNPSGKNIPPANGGQRPDGFYRLLAMDILDPNPQIFVNDTGSGTIFGPFTNGTNIKYTQAPGAMPGTKTMGDPNSAVFWHITGVGDAAVFAMNNGGVNSTQVSCLVPPPPK